jgi:hypothetical protein
MITLDGKNMVRSADERRIEGGNTIAVVSELKTHESCGK